MSASSDTTSQPPALSNSFATSLPELAFEHTGAKFPSPSIVALNDDLARALGFNPAWLRSDEGIAFLTGQGPKPESQNSIPTPVAMAYAGHQFGNYSPILGDGRALLLGEVQGPAGLTGLPNAATGHSPTTDAEAAQDAHCRTQTYDLHAKGTGPTPFSRGGDGKATLAAALREYLISEAMFAQGIPTTRALAVIATGERIQRPVQPAFTASSASQQSAKQQSASHQSVTQPPVPQHPTPQPPVQPGAIIVRVATSHLRVGTFQLVANSAQDPAPLLNRLIDFASRRHHIPSSAPSTADPSLSEKARDLLRNVVKQQAELIARWLAAGFVHGVMNTDNCSISGETIDYGPCAFLDAHDPNAVFSSIDTQGRYRFGAQPTMAGWNLARLAEALLPILDEDPDQAFSSAQEIISEFSTHFGDALTRHWLPKLGLDSSLLDGQLAPDATTLVRDWQKLLGMFSPDHTNVHRALIDAVHGDFAPIEAEFARREEHEPRDESDLQSEADQSTVATQSDVGRHQEGTTPPKLRQWLDAWNDLLLRSNTSAEESAIMLEQANPLFIPRNHLVTEALADAAAYAFTSHSGISSNMASDQGTETSEELRLFTTLLDAVTHPFDSNISCPAEFTQPAPTTFGKFTSYCGT